MNVCYENERIVIRQLGQQGGRSAGRSNDDPRWINRVRDMRRPAAELRRRNDEDESAARDRRKAERSRGGRHEYLRCDHASLIVRMIDERARAERNHRLVPGEMRMHRLAVMVRGVLHVEMHVRQRSGDRSGLHEHDEHGGGQPAKHEPIVVNCLEADT